MESFINALNQFYKSISDLVEKILEVLRRPEKKQADVILRPVGSPRSDVP